MILKAGLTVFLYANVWAHSIYAAEHAKIAKISFGDVLELSGPLNSKSTIDNSFRRLRDAGYTTIYWRMLWEGHPQDDLIFSSSQFNLVKIQSAKERFKKYAISLGSTRNSVLHQSRA
jgi:hypothetical protein